jgi:hypothetical protein
LGHQFAEFHLIDRSNRREGCIRELPDNRELIIPKRALVGCCPSQFDRGPCRRRR